MRRIIILSLALLLHASAFAAGFNNGYVVKSGDYDGNGKTDLFVKAPPKKIVPVSLDDLTVPIPICCDVPDFLLLNDGAQGFTIAGNLSPATRSALAQWPNATDLDLSFRDVDADGKKDLEISGIAQVASKSFDQIIYAGTANQAPTERTSENAKFQRYHEQVFGWQQDHNYFDNNAPLKVKSVSQGGPVQWYASFADPTNVALINQFEADCNYLVGAPQSRYICLTTSTLPAGTSCQQPDVIIYDSAGNPVGQGPDDICQKPVHVVVFLRTLVIWEKDYSGYDPDARETTDILKRLENTCPVFNNGDGLGLTNIIERVYQRILASTIGRSDTPNSFDHEPFPGDEIFAQRKNDVTYHHYDVLTRVCTLGQANCTMSVVRDSALRYFSLPSRKLQPLWTNIVAPPGPYPYQIAYITAPGLTSYPNYYVLFAGLITQRFAQSTRWAGAVQNVTESVHIVYPGMISRYVWQRDNGLTVFTHGIGINRAFCTLQTNFRPYNILLGMSNDVFGPKAFGQLDKQMIKYWTSHYGSGVGKIELQKPYDGPIVAKKASITLPP